VGGEGEGRDGDEDGVDPSTENVGAGEVGVLAELAAETTEPEDRLVRPGPRAIRAPSGLTGRYRP
jgi:hypothetical protein